MTDVFWVQWLSSAPEQEKSNINIDMLRNCAGMYHFLVSPDSGIRFVKPDYIKHGSTEADKPCCVTLKSVGDSNFASKRPNRFVRRKPREKAVSRRIG